MSPRTPLRAAGLLVLTQALSCHRDPSPPSLPGVSATPVFPGLVAEGRWESRPGDATPRSRLWTSDPQARIRFSFTGERLALFRRVSPDAGTVEVCIDDACRRVVNTAPRDFGIQPVHFTGLSPGAHSVRMTLHEGEWFDLDRVQAEAAPGRLGPGFHEDTDPDIDYQGSWLLQRREGPSDGTVHTSFDPDARLEGRFEGDGLALFTVRFDDRDEVEACVDGVCHRRDHYAPALLWQEPWVFTGLGAGEHRLVLKRLRGRYLDLDALEVLPAGQPLPPGSHPSSHPGIRYFGAWNEGRFGGRKERSSSQPGATLSLSFAGTGIVLFRFQDTDRGRSELCVDGTCRDVDSFAPAPVPRSPLAIRGLRPGVHRLTLRHLSGRYLDLEGVEVLG